MEGYFDLVYGVFAKVFEKVVHKPEFESVLVVLATECTEVIGEP